MSQKNIKYFVCVSIMLNDLDQNFLDIVDSLLHMWTVG